MHMSERAWKVIAEIVVDQALQRQDGDVAAIAIDLLAEMDEANIKSAAHLCLTDLERLVQS